MSSHLPANATPEQRARLARILSVPETRFLHIPVINLYWLVARELAGYSRVGPVYRHVVLHWGFARLDNALKAAEKSLEDRKALQPPPS